MRKKRIGIINCGKRKDPTFEKVRAMDRYTGSYFKVNLQYMREVVKPDQILILTLHIPLYTTLPELTKSTVINPDSADVSQYTVLVDAEEEIYPYESGPHVDWGTPVLRNTFKYGVQKWIEDNNIDVNEIEVISLVGKRDHEFAIDPFFPNNTRLFPEVGMMGKRLGIITSELKKRGK